MLRQLVDRLEKEQALPPAGLVSLLQTDDEDAVAYLAYRARMVAQSRFGRGVYVRGLVEISNVCRNNCYYCGIRRGNATAVRCRLGVEDIVACCREGHRAGFRTFVLQGGEDPAQDEEFVARVVTALHKEFPDSAITLSLGEKPQASYERFFRAGANRYLLRHETFGESHYRMLHPEEMSRKARLQCLYALKRIGYQVGTGIMVGSPGQTLQNVVDDLLFMSHFRPQMIGVGPFVPHRATPFADELPGSVSLTLRLLSVLRLMHPASLIPATTALSTLSDDGHVLGVLAGANVVMPNLSPINKRACYELYNRKAAWGAESAEGLAILQKQLETVGYHVDYSRGDYKE